MRATRSGILALVFLTLAIGLLSPARGAEPVRAFLDAAYARGYGQVAIDYLQRLKAAGRLPADIAETLDLELSRFNRLAVTEAFNAAEAQERLATAQAHFDKFVKQHPDHPQVPRAISAWGEIALDQALQRIRGLAKQKDTALAEQERTAARADLEDARVRFTQAAELFHRRYLELKKALPLEGARRPKSAALLSKKQRDAQQAARDAEIDWLECRLQQGKLDFYLAQTFADEKSPERKAALDKAAKAFDAIFQQYRESRVGLYAHMWHGRVADALANDELAIDIYDEVLAAAPEGREKETGLEALFAQVQYHRLLVTLRKDGPADFLAQAAAWLQLHQSRAKLDGYQGIALEVVKVNLAEAAKLSGSKKTAATRTALARLSELAKVPSEYQQEAILLRRELTQSTPQDLASVKTFDEALAVGESAAQSLDWPAAAAALERAMSLTGTAKDKKRIPEAQNRLDQAHYHLAAADYAAGKWSECLAAAERLVNDRPDSPVAPPAASLAVSAALSLYAEAQDKPAALDRLTKLASHAIERWPDKPEADDARIALGQASLVRGELPAAVQVFEAVNPRSLRYPTALFLAAQTNWRLYLAARAKSGAAEPGDAARLRAIAEEQLRTSLAAQRKPPESKTAEATQPAARQLLETQLLLTEVCLEKGEAKEAVELAAPLVRAIQSEKITPPDNFTLRALLAGVRARAASGDAAGAAQAATLLVELGPDNPATNGVLVTMLKSLDALCKQGEAEAIAARTAGDPRQRTAAETAFTRCKELVAPLAAQLATRQENTLAAQIYIADCSAQLGQADAARALYLAILERAEADEAFKKSSAQALTRIRAQLVGLLRQQGEYAEGLKQVDQLIAAHPNALEPKMEKGRLLQSWANDDPAHYDAAVAHWTTLRVRLASLAKKPPEYYEVVYNAALCLFTAASKTHSQQKALQAEQLLNATVVLSPKLSGPEMVARYRELLQKARRLQDKK